MKSMVRVLILFGCASSLFADCDSTISNNDTIGSVRAQLVCLADENARLKQQLANTRPHGELRISTSASFGYFNSDFSVEQCVNRAIHVVVNRGGSVVDQGPGWVDLRLG